MSRYPAKLYASGARPSPELQARVVQILRTRSLYLFAQELGTSPELLSKIEYGIRAKPDAIARVERLLAERGL